MVKNNYTVIIRTYKSIAYLLMLCTYTHTFIYVHTHIHVYMFADIHT